MTNREKFFAILIVFLIIAVSSLIFIVWRSRNELQNCKATAEQPETTTENQLDETDNINKEELSASLSAHLVWWDQDKGFQSIQDHSKLITSITPFWYELSTSGHIEPFTGAADQEITDYLRSRNIKIVPIISNEFAQEPLSTILANSTQRESHIMAIVNLAIDEKYDGISLNYENLKAEDKKNFSTFVSELAQELHLNSKSLSVHVHAKTEDIGTWNGPQSQDWSVIGEAADEVKIMAYDYHWSTSEPGAIAPPSWVEDVITYAVSVIPKEKIFIGMPLYGYDWVGEQATDLTYDKVEILLNLNNISASFSQTDKSPYFIYSDTEGITHEVWFENADSLRYKLELAKNYAVGGVDFWRLGGEDTNIWAVVKEVLGETSES